MDSAREEIAGYKAFINSRFLKTNTNTSSSDYYANYFYNHARNGNMRLWNFWAFLFSPFWFFYRKMILAGLIAITADFFLTTLALNLAEHYQLFDRSLFSSEIRAETLLTSLAGLICLILILAVPLVSGFYGNYLYFIKYKRIFRNLPSDKAPLLYLACKGGTSWLSLIIAIIIVISISKAYL